MAVIKSIGGLEIPPTLSGNAEKFNADSTRRTVSMRMITKFSPTEKWRVTLDYEDRAITLDSQRKLYAKINSMRKSPEIIVFEDPETGDVLYLKMRTTQSFSPRITTHNRNKPTLYTNAGAVFEEI